MNAQYTYLEYPNNLALLVNEFDSERAQIEYYFCKEKQCYVIMWTEYSFYSVIPKVLFEEARRIVVSKIEKAH